MGSQVLGGVGLAAGATVGSLLAEKISGRTELAGLGGTFQVLGSALIAIPMAQLANRSGRRHSLTTGYLMAIVGAVLMVSAAAIGSFSMFLLGSLLLGGATATNSAARYAAVDLALPEHRGRDLSLVVWVTTIGSVLGPNLAGPAEPLARALGVDVLAGPFVISAIALTLGALLIFTRLRPDPLVLARELAGSAARAPKGALGRGIRLVVTTPRALAAVIVIAIGHAVMVAVMVMTPLHMVHGHAALTVVGLVISGHILGMFAFSPLMGLAVDRVGAPIVAAGGGVVLIVACLSAARAPAGHSALLTVGLFLLGLGWSATLVSGSTLLVGSIPLAERASAQGSSDLLMGLAAASGGAVAGVVVDQLGYAALARISAGFAVLVILAALAAARPMRLRDLPGSD